jgi:polysaccharide biosynthesis protein PelB
MKSMSDFTSASLWRWLFNLLLAIVLGFSLLFTLFPGPDRLKALVTHQETDVLSIIYLQLVLHTHPKDRELRWSLAQKLVKLGRWSDARDVLTPLLGEPGEQQARVAVLEIDFLMANALPSDKRDSLFANMTAQLETLSAEVLRPPAVARLAQISLAVNRPDLAALLHRKLVERDSIKRQTSLDPAGQTEAVHFE